MFSSLNKDKKQPMAIKNIFIFIFQTHVDWLPGRPQWEWWRRLQAERKS
jgi:hypothetical protein